MIIIKCQIILLQRIVLLIVCFSEYGVEVGHYYPASEVTRHDHAAVKVEILAPETVGINGSCGNYLENSALLTETENGNSTNVPDDS